MMPYQAYRILQGRLHYSADPRRVDKFFNVLVDWKQYLAPFIGHMFAPGLFLAIVGVVEIVAGLAGGG